MGEQRRTVVQLASRVPATPRLRKGLLSSTKRPAGICEECGERSVLYNVLKDGDAMQQRLENHHAESDTRAALMNTLVAEVKASCLPERTTGASPGQ